MKFTAAQIAEILEGKVDGNPDAEVSKLAKIEEGSSEALTFLSNQKYAHYIYDTKASVCIVNSDFKLEKKITPTLIRVEDAYQAFTKLLEYYNQIKLDKKGLETPHHIAESATYGKNVYVGAFTYIGENVKLGENVKIYPNVFIGDNTEIGDNSIVFAGVKIYSETQIGDNCIIHSGVVLGADGFGYQPDETGAYKKVPQIGNVVIENDVEIGAGTTIDRATLGSTIIRKGVKLDNQIQIAHNVEIGEHTAVAAQTGIAGSSKIGKNCVIGGQVGIAGHLKIGNRVKVQAQTGIGRDLNDDEAVQGSPALPYSDYNKSYVHFKNLPKSIKKLNNIEKKLTDNG